MVTDPPWRSCDAVLEPGAIDRTRGATASTRYRVRAGYLALALLASPRFSRAHEIGIDHLTLWIEQERSTLRGELTLSPDLTRDRSAPIDSRTEARVRELVRRLRIRIDGHACDPKLQVRELWRRGGAVPGDIVMLSCPSTLSARELDVVIERPFDALAVTLESRDMEGSPAQSMLLRAGVRSPPLRLGASGPSDGWRPGGAERLVGVAPNPVPASAERPPMPNAATPVSRARHQLSDAADERAPASAFAVIRSYCRLGVEHILPFGLDHVAFVIALVLGAKRRRELALDVSLFTLAHSLTLGLGARGGFALPGAMVEPLITFSIAVVGMENLFAAFRARSSGAETRQWSGLRRSVVFAFGLLHGLGFAGALRELRVSSDSFVPALLGFNVGVELAQLAVAALVLLALSWTARESAARSEVASAGSWALVALGLGWTGARLVLG